jgi:oxygen-dependent protoporphyrinogen oxidase
VGHSERIDAIMQALQEGLFLAGSAYRGIGIPDCIQSGTQSAESAINLLLGKF